AEQQVTIASRSAISLSSQSMLSEFYDITYAYRFGPRAHDATVVTLRDAISGDLIGDAFHFPQISPLPTTDVGLQVVVEQEEDRWFLRLVSRRIALFLHIDDTILVPEEDWLHLPPDQERRIAFLPGADQRAVPNGEIRALNMDRVVRYAG